MPVVWHVLCAASGDRFHSGWGEVPYSCGQWMQAGTLHWGPCLEAVRTEMFCYHLFHALKCSSFIKTAVKEFRIILLESQKRKLKIKCPCCSQGMRHFMYLCDLTSQGIPGEAVQAGRKPRSGSSGFRTCAWLTLMILFVISNGAERKALQWA